MPRIVIFAGDGVGPEVVAEAVKVLTATERRSSHCGEVIWFQHRSNFRVQPGWV